MLVALFVATCLSAPALADTYDSVVARGIAAKERALETNLTRDWEEALQLFAAAISLNPTKEAEFEFAEAAAQLHLDDEAFDAYREALAKGLSGKAAERARLFVDAHASTFGALDLQGPAGTQLYVNGRKRGVLPLPRPLSVSPGTLQLVATAAGFRSWERAVSVEAGQMSVLELVLAPDTPPATPLPAPAALPPAAPRHEVATRSALSAPGSRWEAPTLVVGGSLTLLAVTGVVVTSVLVADRRKTLASNCARLVGDECRGATNDRVEEAQSAADDLVTFERLRWASVGVGAVGLGAVALSAWRLSHRAPPKAGGGGSLQISQQEIRLQWGADF